jgi:predicted methyltransferase
MKTWKHTTWTVALCVLGGALASVAQAQDEQATRMSTALASPGRPQADKDRDAVRKPIETTQFLGIKTGQTVVDVIAVGGWFTEVLSAAVGPSGKVYGQNPTFFTTRPNFAETENARNSRLGNVTPIHGDLPGDIAGKADAAITALNLHDIYGQGGEVAAVALCKQVFDTLKPGGVFGVIDHVGVAGRDNKAMHRMEASVAKDVLTKAGFTIEAESSILQDANDDHTKPVFQLQRHTDQFLIRARKPR